MEDNNLKYIISISVISKFIFEGSVRVIIEDIISLVVGSAI